MSSNARSMIGIPFAEMVYYDESSPSGLRHACDKTYGNGDTVYAAYKDGVAGSLVRGYWLYATSKYGIFPCHRIIYLLVNNLDDIAENLVVDHIDGNKENNKIENLRLITRSENARNTKMYKNNTSGVVGVYFDNKFGKDYWKASWCDINGKQKTKSFSISKYGDAEARRLAEEHRSSMIHEQNTKGAGYTERHGK